VEMMFLIICLFGKYIVDITIPKRIVATGDYIPYLNFTSDYASNFNVLAPLDILRFKVTDSISARGNGGKALTVMVLSWKIA
jgi:hypothetical protein